MKKDELAIALKGLTDLTKQLVQAYAAHTHTIAALQARVQARETQNAVCRVAQVEGRTPHSARHAMGKHLMAKTGNVAAIQRQLGHRQAAYALQYARMPAEELGQVLEDR